MWKSKGLPDESIRPPPIASNNSLPPVLNQINTKYRVHIDRRCLKQEKGHLLIKNWLIFILPMR